MQKEKRAFGVFAICLVILDEKLMPSGPSQTISLTSKAVTKPVRLHEAQAELLPQEKEARQALIVFGLSILPYRIKDVSHLPSPCKSMVRITIDEAVWEDIERVAEVAGDMDRTTLIRAAIHFGLCDRFSPGYCPGYRAFVIALSEPENVKAGSDPATGLFQS